MALDSSRRTKKFLENAKSCRFGEGTLYADSVNFLSKKINEEKECPQKRRIYSHRSNGLYSAFRDDFDISICSISGDYEESDSSFRCDEHTTQSLLPQ